MRVQERLKQYIEGEIAAGNLHPGDRLPSLRNLTEILGGSYVTMRSAMEKLRKEHVVVVNNTGSYLSGTNKIRVRLNIIGSDLSIESMKRLLNKHLANTELYLDLDIHENGEIQTLAHLKKIRNSYSAALTIDSAIHSSDDHLPAASLKEFSDYWKHLSRLKISEGRNFEFALPFINGTAAMGVNTKLMEKIGFDFRKITSDFEWWEEYVEKCRYHNLPPSILHWDRKHLFLITSFFRLLLSLCSYSPEKYFGKEPLFRTPGGRRFLKILSDVKFVESPLPASTGFFRNETPFLFHIGTWISVQNKNPAYPGIAVDSLEVIPYRNKNGSVCYLKNCTVLEAWFRETLVREERKRVWNLMKIMTSRDFQLDYCRETGQISSLKDIYPTEYYWNRDGRWNAFFPNPEDGLLWQHQLFNRNITGILSTLLEMYVFDHADADTILTQMDLKKSFPKINK